MKTIRQIVLALSLAGDYRPVSFPNPQTLHKVSDISWQQIREYPKH